ncbi:MULTISPECIES: hypothetical protein [Priestia]|uniref:hypothetical protein n=1 Tax=Priestia TaxID=2800373 RepID=UPI001C8DBFCD|nr:hypothetical protein [Priestia aryabhattai]MBY0213525.1 hypothetical protein [Priestia aryabhattai]MDT0148396.1 hypothetical protein [Priestia aryabhattai]MDT0153738.1 hypothetical protein [Priestia aryabhattai]
MNRIVKKHTLMSRGSFQTAAFLLLFSPLFTHSFQQNVWAYITVASIMVLFNLTTECILVKKISSVPKNYTAFFQTISLPVNTLLLYFFYLCYLKKHLSI